MSFWEKDIHIPTFEPLKEERTCDVLIIGGGMAGLNLFYALKDLGDVCLVEANTLGCGVTKNTTAKLTYLQDNTLGTLIKQGNFEKARLYLQAELEGISIVQSIIQKEKISCDWEKVRSYFVTDQEKYFEELEQIKSFLEKEGIEVKKGIPEDTSFLDGIYVSDTYVFHPLKYLEGLVKSFTNPTIYEQTRVVSMKRGLEGYECKTQTGISIFAKKVIVACHYPFFLLPFFLPLKTSIEKSYMFVKPVSKNLKYTYITLEKPSKSSRFYQEGRKKYQIFLGASHSTFTKQNDLQNFRDVMKVYHLKENEIISAWSNVDILTFDNMPFIGTINSDLFCVTGFGTWGMIQSFVSTKVIFDLLTQGYSKYDELFTPNRSFLKRLLVSPYYMGLNAFSLLPSKFYQKSWYSDKLTFFRQHGTLFATYEDENGGKHTVHPVCPHLKCGLIFNEKEKTWDCPCHSSRFNLDGVVIKGPSNYSISIRHK